MNFDLFDKTAEQRFLEYHRENPMIYRLFIKFAEEAWNAGFRRFSAETIINRIRWYVNVETRGDTFKINNNYKPFYARKLVEEFPKFDGFFEFREQKSVK